MDKANETKQGVSTKTLEIPTSKNETDTTYLVNLKTVGENFVEQKNHKSQSFLSKE